MRRACAALLAAAFAAAFGHFATAAEPAPIVAIGDVHGAYAALTALLERAKLVDAKLDWSGGNARLVLLGDVVDRGTGSRRALELVMRLQREAPRAGGRVVLVLGNHEVMNLLGDLRYVSADDFAEYADVEPAAVRDDAWRRFSAANGGRDDAELRTAFAMRFPLGFFGQRAAFGRHGELGAWLLEQPVIATIDRTAFVHGGLPAAAAGRSADALNAAYGAVLRDYADAVERLVAAGALYPEQTFDERAARATALAAGRGAAAGALPADVRRDAALVAELGRSEQLGPDALFWYRGTAACSAAVERGRLAQALAALGVDRVVIGHTPTRSARIETRFDGTVVRADTGMLASYFGGRASAVVIRGNAVGALYAEGGDERAPVAEPRAVGTRGGDDDALERALLAAPLPSGREPAKLALEPGGREVAVVAQPGIQRPRGAADLPAVAAYRLDRLLGLDLVPVAVKRVDGGRVRALALDASELPDENARRDRGGASWCPLADQLTAMYAFDALAGNPGRGAAQIRYTPDSWQLVLADNERSFGVDTRLPSYLARAPIALPAALRAKLEGLDEALLERQLGDVLDAREIRAIVARRDRLLALDSRSTAEATAQ